MSKERVVIIILLASLLATNIGWFYLGSPSGGASQTNDFDEKIQELRDKECNIRLLYQLPFENYKQSYEEQGYNFTQVDWTNFNEKLNEYEERKGIKAATIYPDGKSFNVHGVNSTIYYHQIE